MIELVIILLFVVACFSFVCFIGSPYIPTKKEWIKESLSIIKLSDKDLVIDLGAGDGRVLRFLAKNNIKSIGYEINPLLFLFAKISISRINHTDVKMKNYWKINLPRSTTVIYAFMAEKDTEKLEKYLEKQSKLINADELKLVTFGFELSNKQPIKQSKISRLYIFK